MPAGRPRSGRGPTNGRAAGELRPILAGEGGGGRGPPGTLASPRRLRRLSSPADPVRDRGHPAGRRRAGPCGWVALRAGPSPRDKPYHVCGTRHETRADSDWGGVLVTFAPTSPTSPPHPRPSGPRSPHAPLPTRPRPWAGRRNDAVHASIGTMGCVSSPCRRQPPAVGPSPMLLGPQLANAAVVGHACARRVGAPRPRLPPAAVSADRTWSWGRPAFRQ